MRSARMAFSSEMRWTWLYFAVLIGCSRTSEPAPPKAAVVSPPVIEVAPTVDAGPAPRPTGCALVDDTNLDDGEGKVEDWGSMALDNVRILESESQTFVTWTRQAQPHTGDWYQSPHSAVRTGTDPFKQVSLPTNSYACATYGIAAPNTPEFPFAFWGVMNTNAFEQYRDLPAVKNTSEYTKADRYVVTPKQDVATFVASRDMALANVTDMSCDIGCQCSESWKDALWLRSLDPKKPFATRVATAKVDAPAFSLTDKGGVAAWRQKGPSSSELFFLLVGADGKPSGKATSFAKGDVGAPAVAMSGNDAVIVWASRPDKTSPYRLQWMKAGQAPKPIATTGAAYAPAILADDKEMVLAWMEGDGGTTGEIHLVRALVDGPVGASSVVSGNEPNARDPELSGTIAKPAIVWQTFTKEKAAGILRVAHAECSSPGR